jgi:hypothetical protein
MSGEVTRGRCLKASIGGQGTAVQGRTELRSRANGRVSMKTWKNGFDLAYRRDRASTRQEHRCPVIEAATATPNQSALAAVSLWRNGGRYALPEVAAVPISETQLRFDSVSQRKQCGLNEPSSGSSSCFTVRHHTKRHRGSPKSWGIVERSQEKWPFSFSLCGSILQKGGVFS